MSLTKAEFAFGGYFKGASTESGVSVGRLAEEVPMGNVILPNIVTDCRFLPMHFLFFLKLPFVCHSRDSVGLAPGTNS